MAVKKHILSESENHLFYLIGISSHENDYRLSWAINKRFGTSFARAGNLVVHNPRIKQNQEFALFQYMDEETCLHYNLISNRCEDGFLLEEMTNIDFMIQIIGETDTRFLNEFAKNLRKIDIITAAFVIDVAKLKSGKKLIF